MFTLTHRKYPKQISSGLSAFIIVAVLINGLFGFTHAQAAAINTGYKDFSMSGATAPTGQKPQSKLWFNDGIWWGVMYNKTSTSKHFEIYRFNWATDTWTTTGVMVDARPKSSADALWTGSKLYTVSNMPVGQSGDVNIYVKRFSYNSTTKTYSVDSGFPVSVYNHAVETVVMDKDTAGKLWVTFTDANSTGGRNAYVTHTSTTDTTWIAPYIVPVSGANTLEDDDISTIDAFTTVDYGTQTSGAIYYKSVRLDNPSMQFVDGLGTPFIVSSTDTHINNASSTKQALNNTTNLLVIAGDDSSHYYFHNKIVLGAV